MKIIGFGLNSKASLMLKNLETTPNLSRLFQSRVNMQRSNKQIPPLSQLETPTYSKKNFTSSVHELKLPKGKLLIKFN